MSNQSEAAVKTPPIKPKRAPLSQRLRALRQIADQTIEAPDIEALTHLLTSVLPGILGVPSVTLLLWDRKLDSFESLSPGETRARPVRPEEAETPAPDARFIITEGTLLETPSGKGDGVLIPLLARSGLVGMLVLGPRGRRGTPPYRPEEATLLSALAARTALALENSLYQREMIASERMAALGTMAGMLVHDFRGPMTVIRGYAETLIEPGIAAKDIADRARLIMDMIDRLDRMTTETLDFARGGGRLARRPVELPRAIEALALDLHDELHGLDIVRDFRVPEGTIGSLDVDKLRRVIGNIAANARDAMGGSGRLHMSAHIEAMASAKGDDRRHLVIELADEGPGVPNEIRERLFDPFVTRGKKGGTGLGLAVARRFVEDHGGGIELLHAGPGARFRLTLPLEAPDPSAPPL